MKTTDLFKTSAKKLNESLAKTFGEKLNLESFDTPKLEDARNKLRTQIHTARTEGGFNENLENEALSKAQFMHDAIVAEIMDRQEHIVYDTVNEGAMDELHADLNDKFNELAPGIEKHKDEAGADHLYNELADIAKAHGAESEFRRMCNAARNSAHMDYDTNPGGFENWFWYLPLGDEQDESVETEARYGNRDSYQRDYDSSRTGFGKRGREDDEYNTPEYNPEFERNKQETYSYNVKVNGEVINDKPFFGRSAALAWAKEQVAAGKLDPKSAVLSPVHGNNEAYDMDQVRKDAADRVKQNIDKQSDDRIAKLKQGGGKDEPFMAQVGRKIIGGVKGAATGAVKGFMGKESIEQTGDDMRNLNEGEIQQASAIVTAKTMVDRVGRWIEELSGMENDTLLTLGDSIRDEMGQEAAKQFISACAPAIQAALENLKSTREALSTSVRALTGEEQPAEMLGAEAPDMGGDEFGGEAEPDAMNPDMVGDEAASDDFGAADAAAGGDEEMGRMKRESIDRSSRLMKVLAG
jgi:hypothetical protein